MKPSPPSRRIAEILIPEGMDRQGRATTIPTSYGRKTREGIGDLIDRETTVPKLLAALKAILLEANFDSDGDSLSRGEKLLAIEDMAKDAIETYDKAQLP